MPVDGLKEDDHAADRRELQGRWVVDTYVIIDVFCLNGVIISSISGDNYKVQAIFALSIEAIAKPGRDEARPSHNCANIV